MPGEGHMKTCLVPLLILLYCLDISAQPEICGPDPLMTPTCIEACIICDLDGYTGTNNSTVPGVGPPDFCTFIQHNIQWIGFIATSEDLSLEISVSNCTGGPGLEVGIWESFDCQNFTLVSNCFGGTNGNAIQDGTSGILMNTVPLVIGQYYYFVMDGNLSAVCDYTIDVIEGSTEVPPLEPIDAIYGDSEVCTGGSLDFNIDPISGAPQVIWFMNGQEVGEGEQVTIEFPESGIVEICVEASNVCSDPVTLCTEVTVVPIPEVQLTDTLCEGQCVTVGGLDYCAAGIYPILLTTTEGCDSNILLTLVEKPPVYHFIDTTICEGEGVIIGFQFFTQSGNYTIDLLTDEGCDSIVELMLDVIPVEQTFLAEFICAGESFQVGNEEFFESGEYIVSLESYQGCDSLVTLILFVGDTANVSLNRRICSGEAVTIGAESFDQSGDYVVELISQSGCDSTINLHLEVIDSTITQLHPTICMGDSLVVDSHILKDSGTYEIALTSSIGCDSILSIHLEVVDSLTTSIHSTICAGDTLYIGTHIFTATGNYTVNYTAVSGCDSMVLLDLEVVDTVFHIVEC